MTTRASRSSPKNPLSPVPQPTKRRQNPSADTGLTNGQLPARPGRALNPTSRQRAADTKRAKKIREKAADASKIVPIDIASPAPEVMEVEVPPDHPVKERHRKHERIGSVITTTQRRVMALNLRIAGHDYRTIAEHLGVNVAQAWHDVNDSLEYLAKHEILAAERYRDLELRRLDALQTLLWPRCEDGDSFAVANLLRLMDMRSKLLGTYPQKEKDSALPTDRPTPAQALPGLPLDASPDQIAERAKVIIDRVAARAGLVVTVAPASALVPSSASSSDDDSPLG